MSDFDPIGRELCPDGACVGIIGPDRICRVCGRPSERPLDPRLRGLAEAAEEPDPGGAAPLDRDLCQDGACIGVIGLDGRCGECGRSAAGESDSPAPDRPASASAEAPGAGASEPPDRPKDDPAFDERELCPDGSCIGLIGADGRCQECGAAAPG